MPRHVLNRVLAECCACTGARCKIIDRVVERIGRTPLVVRAFSDACRTRRVRVHRLAAASASHALALPAHHSPAVAHARWMRMLCCCRSAAAPRLLSRCSLTSIMSATLLPCYLAAHAPMPHALRRCLTRLSARPARRHACAPRMLVQVLCARVAAAGAFQWPLAPPLPSSPPRAIGRGCRNRAARARPL